MAQDKAGQKEKAKEKRPTPLKRNMQNVKRNMRNRVMKSRVHTAIRHYEEALEKGNSEDSRVKLNEAFSLLDKAAQKGVMKKNTSDRKKARLHARLSG